MSRVSRTFKFTGRVIKFLFSLFIIFICVFLLWRVFGSGDPDSMKTLAVNESLYEAYNKSEGELEVFNQGHLTITTAKDNRGYFSLTKTAIIPEANQIQVVLRYNNGTIRHLEEDFALETTPNRTDDLFDVSLFFAVDLTPDNEEDNAIVSDEGTRTFRCSSRLVESDTKGLYNYRKFVFDLDEKAYGTIFIYDYKAKNIDIVLDKVDVNNIESWKADD